VKRCLGFLSPAVVPVVALVGSPAIRLQRHEDHDKPRTAENALGNCWLPLLAGRNAQTIAQRIVVD
jgi:hypothetical protein